MSWLDGYIYGEDEPRHDSDVFWCERHRRYYSRSRDAASHPPHCCCGCWERKHGSEAGLK